MAKTRGSSKAKATKAEATKAKKSPAAKKPAAASKKAASAAVANASGSKHGAAVDVVINKEKPGKGNFVVRLEGKEEPILELLGMKRPFAALKALDMDDIGKEVMDAL
eukprot:scaffold40822_cov155-Skeletonema_dohrnii-CCMP3373.AAC.2